MRISDWSSDVCSSDLRRVDAAFSVHPPVRPSVAHEPLQIFIVRRQDDRRLPLVAVAQESLAIALHGAIEIIEIGVLAIAGGIDARRLAVGVAADDLRFLVALGADRRRLLLPRGALAVEIGRASCRERVWQYV